METNEKAQAVLKLIHDVSGDLYEASQDGKIETAEAIKALVNAAPSLLALAGVELGNG